MLTPPCVDLVTQRPVMDAQIPGDPNDRPTGLDDHLHGLGLELRTKLAALFRHGLIRSTWRTCPRSLVHLRVDRLGKAAGAGSCAGSRLNAFDMTFEGR